MGNYNGIIFTLVVGIVVFSLLLGHASITGNAVLPPPDELRNQIADFVTKIPPSVLVKDASACVIIEQDGYQSFEVNKSGTNLLITKRYCAEDKDKDAIIKFNSYDAFLNNYNNPDSLTQNHGKDYWLFPSAMIQKGGGPVCNEIFRTRFCAASFYYATKAEMEAQNFCCTDYTPTSEEQAKLDELQSLKKKILSPTNISGVGSLIIIFSSTALLLLGAIVFVLHSKSKKKEHGQKVEELRQYVTQTLQSGYSPQQVRETLASSGWKPEDIEEAFK